MLLLIALSACGPFSEAPTAAPAAPSFNLVPLRPAPRESQPSKIEEITDKDAADLWKDMAEELHLDPKDGWKLPGTTEEIIQDIVSNGGCYCRVDSRNAHMNTMRVSGCHGVEEIDGKPWLVEYPSYAEEGYEINYSMICERTNRAISHHIDGD